MLKLYKDDCHSMEPLNNIHTCDICKAQETWNVNWMWKYEIIKGDAFGPGYEIIRKYCSEKCRRMSEEVIK